MPATYVPKCYARARNTQYGEMLNISFDAAALIEFVQANTNQRGEFKITVSKRREPSDKGVTHSVALDTFVPKAREGGSPSAPRAPRPDSPPPGSQAASVDAPPKDDSNVPF